MMITKIKNKILRTLFQLINKVNFPPGNSQYSRSMRKIKIKLLKKSGLLIGENVNIRPKSIVGYISIGDNSGIGDYCEVHGSKEAPVFIGKDVMMAPECIIYTQNHEHEDVKKPMRLQGYSRKSVVIGDNVWIGRRVMIMPGAKINNGTIIAAGAVVPGKEFPENVILGGVPAKVIKYREVRRNNK